MSRYRRAEVAGASYFFTVVTERRQPVLLGEDVRCALREAIETVRVKRPFVIDAWVLLPDHLHAIWTLPEGDMDFSTRWRLIKAYVTRRCGEKYHRPEWLTARRAAKHCGTLWQHRYWEHLLRDDKDFERHMDYVHFNPVKHDHVKTVSDWPYSSFHRWVKAGVYGLDWVGDGSESPLIVDQPSRAGYGFA
ncbi:MAG: transposase [Uliginosibacterium sp.]|jgi:putative transposase|nr:transposase [Uliginosibacterium sp.]